jgi:hypothetical protein
MAQVGEHLIALAETRHVAGVAAGPGRSARYAGRATIHIIYVVIRTSYLRERTR